MAFPDKSCPRTTDNTLPLQAQTSSPLRSLPHTNIHRDVESDTPTRDAAIAGSIPPYYGNATFRFISETSGERNMGLPQNDAALFFGETNTARGLGVFARSDIPTSTNFIEEMPLLSCSLQQVATQSTSHSRLTGRAVSNMWENMSYEERDVAKRCFWKLRLVSSTGKPWRGLGRHKLRQFMREYSFEKQGKPRSANIYRLTSRINHACPRCANARVYVDPSTAMIEVKAVKHIFKDEEIFIFYNRKHRNLPCPICHPGLGDGMVGTYSDIFKRRLSRLVWKGNEYETSIGWTEVVKAKSGTRAHIMFRRSSTTTSTSNNNDTGGLPDGDNDSGSDLSQEKQPTAADDTAVPHEQGET